MNISPEPRISLETEFAEQLNYMLTVVNYTEWSGLLFYKFQGDITDISNMSFTLVALYPLDIGSSAYTEYNMAQHTNDVMRLYDEHPELLGCKMGHIHSHHNMQVFASGTDMEQLRGGILKEQFDMLLSVIVNNKREVWAGVAFKVKHVLSGTKTTSLMFNGKTVDSEVKYEEEATDVVWTKCSCDTSNLIPDYSRFQHVADKTMQLRAEKKVSGNSGYGRGTLFADNINEEVDLYEAYKNMAAERGNTHNLTPTPTKPKNIDVMRKAFNTMYKGCTRKEFMNVAVSDEETLILVLTALYDLPLSYNKEGDFILTISGFLTSLSKLSPTYKPSALYADSIKKLKAITGYSKIPREEYLAVMEAAYEFMLGCRSYYAETLPAFIAILADLECFNTSNLES